MLHLVQAATQAFAFATLAAFAVVLIRQSVMPAVVALASSFSRWHTRNFKKPRLLAVPDLSAEAPGCCNICLNDWVDDESAEGLLRLSCGHVFHMACIRGWLDRRRTCPMCRRRVSDLRRCTQIVHKIPTESPRGGAHQAVAAFLEGNMLVPMPSVVVSVPSSPISRSSSASSSSSLSSEARNGQSRPRAVTLGAVPEVGTRSDVASPVELRPHIYRRPRSLSQASRARRSFSAPAMSAPTEAVLSEEDAHPRLDVPIQAWAPE